MIQRVIRYKDNQSILALVVNFCILVYIIYITVQFSGSMLKYFLLAAYAVLFFLPLAFSTFLSNHVHGTIRLMKYSQYVLYAYIVVLITNVIAIPFIVFLMLVLFVVFSIGIAFWFYSHPTIMTSKTYAKEINRQEVREEKALRKEIHLNQRELNKEE